MNTFLNIINKYAVVLPFFIVYTMIAGLQEAEAQSDDKAFRYFTPQDGFPAYVFRMDQGPKGQIWMAGPAGLSKFDGYTIHNFFHDPSDVFSIPEGLTFEVMTDTMGNLWFTGTSGVSFYDSKLDQFSVLEMPDSLSQDTFFADLFQASDEYIWVPGNKGLYKIAMPSPDRTKSLEAYYQFEDFIPNENRVHEIAEGTEGALWLTSNQGLYHFDPNTEQLTKKETFKNIPSSIDLKTVEAILNDQNNTIWVGVKGGLLVFENGSEEPEYLPLLGKGDQKVNINDIDIVSIDPGRDGAIWISTNANGAIKFDPATNEVFQYQSSPETESISENMILEILEDRDGNIWFGHPSSGMSMMFDRTWTYNFNKIVDTDNRGERFNNIRTIAKDSQSDLWFGTASGLAWAPSSTDTILTYIPGPEKSSAHLDNFVTNLAFHKDKIFTSSNFRADSKIFVFNKKEETFSRVPIPDSLAYFEKFVSDNSNIYWTVPGVSQLVSLNKENLSIEAFNLPIFYSGRDSQEDSLRLANPYMGNESELYIKYSYTTPSSFSSDRWKYFRFNSDLKNFNEVTIPPQENIRVYTQSLLTTPSDREKGIFWSRSEAGILKEDLVQKESTYFPIDQNSKTFPFGASIMDSSGVIWFTDLGSSLRKFEPKTGKVNTYLLDMNRMPSFMATAIRLESGHILFGGQGGYIEFDPMEVRDDSDIQNIYLTEFRTGSESIAIGDLESNYEVDYTNNNLSFRYLGINYRSPDSRYRYRLLGYNEDWVNVETQRNIFFANLPFGDYTFEVQVTTPGSSFSEESNTASIAFSILPPWWRTTFAYIMYFMLFSGFIFGVDRVQRKRLIQKERERATAKELEQAKEIEKAYENLKTAQDQLIQQEKLASLGQLTAGIAHEIKNPLNFVNNFSDLSIELIEEALEELEKYPSESKEVDDILKDITSNLRKIHEHGSRADSIVKSMLQHSRGGDGKMEPTPLNLLIKEYVYLAFHGMRAGKVPINVDIDLQLGEDIGEVPLVAEDFSRVILNLVNNAFDAMQGAGHKLERSDNPDPSGAQDAGDYEPKLTVRTRSENGKVVIEIEDNGPGIPDDVKDKIMQPFFTTKKGTQGTGLGLSITNDIVKAHGGSLEIYSDPGQTQFRIILNI